jgi:hypothetical protein
MPDQELFDEQVDRELTATAIFLTTKARRTALTLQEFIETRLALGASIEQIETMLLEDLRNNGRMFGEFRRAIRATSYGSVKRMRDISYFSEFDVDRQYRWSAVFVNTCSHPPTAGTASPQGCMERHGLLKTWAEWEKVGLPRTGATLCRENCRCVLIPKEFTALEPIKREKRKRK